MTHSKLFIFDSDRKTGDLLLAFLTYQGYDTTVVTDCAGFLTQTLQPLPGY